MTERELRDAVEVIPDRLFWVALHTAPTNTLQSHYFCIDNALTYEPFFADFGPLNLSMVFRYCKMVHGLMQDPSLKDKRLIHYCSADPKKRSNAAFLICAYQVIMQRKRSDAAFEPFLSICPPFLPFRDASNGPCNWHLTIPDCLQGLEYSIQFKWFDWGRFDVDSYEFFERVENGDMSWIIPERFLAFAGPCPESTDMYGYRAFTPEDYVPIFREAGIGLVVRLNKKQYDRRRFIDHGIKHVDLYFLDGSCPPVEIIAKFLHIAESESSAIAVHCKAGLGRTGTLIGMYAMKHFKIPARAFVGWNRICRPGSILGPQQHFLCDMEKDMFQAGEQSIRRPLRSPMPDGEFSGGAAEELAQQIQIMRQRGAHQGESYTDNGQGDRLVEAKSNRLMRNGDSPAGGPTPDSPGVPDEGSVTITPPQMRPFGNPFSASRGQELQQCIPGQIPGATKGAMGPIDGSPSSQESRTPRSMLPNSLLGIFTR